MIYVMYKGKGETPTGSLELRNVLPIRSYGIGEGYNVVGSGKRLLPPASAGGRWWCRFF